MRFNWKKFLDRQRIPYVTSGPNVGKNNINVRCPFCGDSDPSEHMGLSVQGWWGCLRNAAHRGKSPQRLIQQLLHCSPEEARRFMGAEAPAPTVDEFASSANALRQLTGATPARNFLELPPEFKPLLNGSPLAVSFLSYLEERGYRQKQIEWLTANYGLRYATKGAFAGRLIIPIQDRYGKLLSWTARTIVKDMQPRYKTLTVREGEGPRALLASNETVLGLQLLYKAQNPETLLIVEGPFDALKLSAFGYPFGVYATCLFGLNVYPAQVAELQELAGRFKRVCLLIDEDAVLHRLRLMQQLAPVGVEALKMPENTDDPGALTGGQVAELCLGLAA